MNDPAHPILENGTPEGRAQLVADLEFCLEDPRWFTLAELLHLQSNFHRLVRYTYGDGEGNGCIFSILTEKRDGERVDCREALTRFFTGGCGEGYREREVYQPAKWVVRAWDMQRGIERYHGAILDRETLASALDKAIATRGARQDAALAVAFTPLLGQRLAAS